MRMDCVSVFQRTLRTVETEAKANRCTLSYLHLQVLTTIANYLMENTSMSFFNVDLLAVDSIMISMFISLFSLVVEVVQLVLVYLTLQYLCYPILK